MAVVAGLSGGGAGGQVVGAAVPFMGGRLLDTAVNARTHMGRIIHLAPVAVLVGRDRRDGLVAAGTAELALVIQLSLRLAGGLNMGHSLTPGMGAFQRLLPFRGTDRHCQQCQQHRQDQKIKKLFHGASPQNAKKWYFPNSSINFNGGQEEDAQKKRERIRTVPPYHRGRNTVGREKTPTLC